MRNRLQESRAATTVEKGNNRKDDNPGGFVLEITWEMQDVKNI